MSDRSPIESATGPLAKLARPLTFVALVLLGISFVVPFVWQVLISLSDRSEVDRLTETGFPSRISLDAYVRVFDQVPFAKYFFNSFFVAGWVTLLQVITCSMAAYAFSRIQWPGRDKVFLLYLGTLMVPGVVLMVPNFVVILGLGMFDDYTGLIIPAAFSAYGTFLLRQFMLTIPSSLDEAAAIDGAGHWRIFTQVILPLAPGPDRAGHLRLPVQLQQLLLAADPHAEREPARAPGGSAAVQHDLRQRCAGDHGRGADGDDPADYPVPPASEVPREGHPARRGEGLTVTWLR
ncbi:MAG: carbohydrate ABC transporter permease [Phycisphaerales bacterium]